MTKTPTLAAAITALAAVVHASRVDIPKATASFEYPLDGLSPKPTLPPSFQGLRQGLKGRAIDDDSSSDDTILVASDATCGYISGRVGAGYSCVATASCVFITATGDSKGAVGCCDDDECGGFKVSCVDYDGYYSKDECDDGCKVDTYTLKCSETTAPYCNTVSFSSSIIDYWCNDIDISTMQEATTTYRGQTDGYSFATVPLSDESTSLKLSPTDTTFGSGPTSQPTPSDDSGSSDESSKDDEGEDDGGSSTPVGPIVGGVVGGVAGIALIGLAIFLFLRHKKKKDAAAASAAAPPMQQGPLPPPGFNGAAATYYDPKHASSPTTGSYPSPNQAYAQPNPAGAPSGFYSVSSQHGSSPDPNIAASPTAYHPTDPRASHLTTSPSPSYPGGPVQPGFQPQPPVIHEAPAQPTDHHRGQMHELA